MSRESELSDIVDQLKADLKSALVMKRRNSIIRQACFELIDMIEQLDGLNNQDVLYEGEC